ncbi:Gp49 family protein [Pectobacterium colocasium]|uniref:Gp49 family protein n=1 Tax=Pectobacterium colocasium TaxID=2878098 RepID=UPI001CD4884F|nr:Gp49 family protein [Pectobacterium colocasium]
MTVTKVEKRDVDALTESLNYQTHHFPGTTVTVAIASLPNGFMVGQGFSATISPELFDADIGKELAIARAKNDAVQKLWELEGYKLKSSR